MGDHVIPFYFIEAVQLDTRIHSIPQGIANRHGDIFSLSSILIVLSVLTEKTLIITYSVIIGYAEQAMSLRSRKVNVPMSKHDALATSSYINSLTTYSWRCHIILILQNRFA